MEPKEFVVKIQGYYGNYKPGQREEIVKYLANKSPLFLESLYEALIASYSSQFNTPPDIAQFNKSYRDALELLDGKVLEFNAKALPEPEAKDYRAEVAEMLGRLAERIKEGRPCSTGL